MALGIWDLFSGSSLSLHAPVLRLLGDKMAHITAHNIKVLLVEDEGVTVVKIQNCLNKLGYTIIFVASSGEEAVKRAEDDHPDIVLMDIVLKGKMDGIEAAQEIRSRFRIPIVYLTLYSDEERLERARKTEPFVYLLKPVRDREIEITIEMALYKHRVEERLKEHDEWLFETLEGFGDAVITTDTLGHVKFMNTASRSLIGWKAEEVYGRQLKEVFDIVDETDQKSTDPITKTLADGDTVKIANQTLITKDGQGILVEGNVMPIKDVKEKIVGAVIVFHDITKYRQSEEHSHKLLMAIEQSPAIVMITDPEGVIEYVNPRFVELTGYTSEEVIGRNPRILKSDKQSKEVYKQMWEMITSGQEWRGEWLNRKKEGELYWESASISAVRNHKGNITNFIKVAEDITHRKLIEEELIRSQCELEERVAARTAELEAVHEQLIHAEKLSAIGKLSASIAHEFNNPIYGIRNVLDRIKKKQPLDKKNKEFVDMAIHECDRVSELIKKLMDFHRPSSGSVSLFNIHNIINDVIMLIQKKLKSRNIRVEKDFSPDMPEIEGIPDQIKQVILNLLNNAEEAILKDDGTIRISTEVKQININVHIQDSGCGIAPEAIGSIFEPFFTTKAVKGTGLGLSVSYGIVKRHGGDIKVSSQPYKGSTFTVTLPIKWGGV